MKISVGVQCRLDLSRCLGIDFSEGNARIAQHLQTGLNQPAVGQATQQHHVAVTSVKFEIQVGPELLQTFFAVERKLLHVASIGRVTGRLAGQPPARHPGQLAPTQVAPEFDRCMPTQQVFEDLPRHAGCSPRCYIPRCDDTGIGKTRFFRSRTTAFQNGDLMTISGKFKSSRDANNSGSDNGQFHYFNYYF